MESCGPKLIHAGAGSLVCWEVCACVGWLTLLVLVCLVCAGVCVELRFNLRLFVCIILGPVACVGGRRNACFPLNLLVP